MAQTRSNGIVVGLVDDLEDPAGLGRVRLRFPHLDGELSDWARLAAPMAGDGRGTFFRPEVGDEVLCAFEHGDPRRPYVVGALWSQADPPPSGGGSARENNWRFIQSRSGHIILLDDTAGQEKIELIDKDGQRRVKIDSANGKIEVTCTQGNVEVSAEAGEVKVKGVTIVVEAQSTLTLTSNGTATVEAQGNLTLRSNGITTIRGSSVAIN
jgi:uncharacterized protein involved in type VI secretion and phage assembly